MFNQHPKHFQSLYVTRSPCHQGIQRRLTNSGATTIEKNQLEATLLPCRSHRTNKATNFVEVITSYSWGAKAQFSCSTNGSVPPAAERAKSHQNMFQESKPVYWL
jgi:hypothetical protein